MMDVLVVDDAPDVRFMLGVLLEEAGMNVEEAESGDEALDRLRDPDLAAPDAIVLDQRMPGMTGLEVARELAADGSDIPVVLFSAYLHPAMHAEAEELGITPIVKTDIDELLNTLGGWRPVACGSAS